MMTLLMIQAVMKMRLEKMENQNQKRKKTRKGLELLLFDAKLTKLIM